MKEGAGREEQIADALYDFGLSRQDAEVAAAATNLSLEDVQEHIRGIQDGERLGNVRNPIGLMKHFLRNGEAPPRRRRTSQGDADRARDRAYAEQTQRLAEDSQRQWQVIEADKSELRRAIAGWSPQQLQDLRDRAVAKMSPFIRDSLYSVYKARPDDRLIDTLCNCPVLRVFAKQALGERRMLF